MIKRIRTRFTRYHGMSFGNLLSGRVIRAMSMTAALLLLTFGCRGGDRATGPEATEATALEIGPTSVALLPGDTAQLEAMPVDGSGNPVSGYDVSWSSGDTAVATVDGDGTVTAVASGSTEVTATAKKSNQSSDNGQGKKKGLTKHSDVTVGDTTTSGDTPSSGLITDLEPAAYEKDTLETGDSVYVDRGYTIEAVPSGSKDWQYVRTANDDKDATSDSSVAFTLTDTARVALAYDVRATTLPDWLQEWTATGDTLRTTDVDHLIYTRVFAPGDVVLGGNLSGGAQGAESMYVLSATRSDSAPDGGSGEEDGATDTTSATGSLKVVTVTSGDSLDDNGYIVSVDAGSERSIGINDTTLYTELSAEDHSVALSDVASNCSVDTENPRSVSVAEGDTTSTVMEISCDVSPSTDVQPVWTANFESGSLQGTNAQGYGWRDDEKAGEREVNQDNPHSGSYSLMIRFPSAGSLNSNGLWPSGTSSMNRKIRYTVGDVPEIWMEFYVYVPDNYVHPEVEGSSDNRKFYALWDDGGDRRYDEARILTELFDYTDTQTPSRPSKGRFMWETKGDGTQENWWTDGASDGVGGGTQIGALFDVSDRGTWVRLRYHLKLKTNWGGEADGEFRFWKNDTLVIEHTGLDWETTSEANHFFRNGHILGSQNSPYPEETKFYFDDFQIWDEDPGWKAR